MSRAPRATAGAMTLLLLTACIASPSASPTPRATASPEPSPTASGSAAPTDDVTAEPTATPEPPLSIDLPDETDDRVVSVEITPRVGEEGGEIIVTVTSQASDRIDELVLRWPTELGETLFLAPFVPSDDRIRDGGPPLVQEWTKWVVGPGEEGEPAGTISLGYGPLLAGATLRIPLSVTRVADGPVSFDLQLLADDQLLNLVNGGPAELRVQVP
jgi:hypothetical protein